MRNGPRWAAALAAVLLLPGWLGTAHAQGCEPKFVFKFADGGVGCLSDYGVVDTAPVGRYFSLNRMVPAQGAYNIAMPSAADHCPAIVGFSLTRINVPGQNNPENSTSARSARAVAECTKALGEVQPPLPGCSCAVVVEDGVSPLTRAAFSAHVGAPR